MDLKTYLHNKRLTQLQFSKLAGIAQSRVAQLIDKRNPSLALATRIEKLTKGQVKANGWLK